MPRPRPQTTWPIGLARLIGGPHRSVSFFPLCRGQAQPHIAQRPLAGGNGLPVIFERLIVHADQERRLLHLREPMLDEALLHFVRPHHRLETIAAPQLARIFVEHGHGIHHHPHARHAAEMVPDRGGDHAARTHDAPHFGDRLSRLGHEVENQKRQRPIEVPSSNGSAHASACWMVIRGSVLRRVASSTKTGE